MDKEMALRSTGEGDRVGGGGVDGLDERLKVLQNVRGFGPGKIASLVKAIGGVDELVLVLDNGDVSTLSSIDRISDRMAVELILAFRGEDPETILKTEGSLQIYHEMHLLLYQVLHSDQHHFHVNTLQLQPILLLML